jgi:hypothetical protein
MLSALACDSTAGHLYPVEYDPLFPAAEHLGWTRRASHDSVPQGDSSVRTTEAE